MPSATSGVPATSPIPSTRNAGYVFDQHMTTGKEGGDQHADYFSLAANDLGDRLLDAVRHVRWLQLWHWLYVHGLQPRVWAADYSMCGRWRRHLARSLRIAEGVYLGYPVAPRGVVLYGVGAGK